MKNGRLLIAALFIASLGLSGASYAHDGEGCNKDGQQAHHGEWKSDIPEAKMKMLHDAMKASFQKDKGLHEQAHKLHDQMKGIMEADNFDPKAFLAVSAKMQSLHDRMRHDRAAAFASVAGQFTPEEREELARMFHHRHGHHQHDGNRDRDGMSDGSHGPHAGNQDYPPYAPR